MMNLPLNVDFTGKVVVVTGAGGVLCGDMARAFAQAGAKVAALDLNEEAVKKLAKECREEGFICEGYKANVLDPEVLKAVHDQVVADLGPCDILVNGAGGNNPRATTDNEFGRPEDFLRSGCRRRRLCLQAQLPGDASSHAGVCQGHGGEEERLYSEYLLHERIHPADKDPGLLRRESSHQ